MQGTPHEGARRLTASFLSASPTTSRSRSSCKATAFTRLRTKRSSRLLLMAPEWACTAPERTKPVSALLCAADKPHRAYESQGPRAETGAQAAVQTERRSAHRLSHESPREGRQQEDLSPRLQLHLRRFSHLLAFPALLLNDRNLPAVLARNHEVEDLQGTTRARMQNASNSSPGESGGCRNQDRRGARLQKMTARRTSFSMSLKLSLKF